MKKLEMKESFTRMHDYLSRMIQKCIPCFRAMGVPMLLNLIFKHGRLKSVILITLSAVVASIIATHAIFFLLGREMPLINQVLSVSIPAVIASLWSWRTVGMILKIHELEQEIRRLANVDVLTSVMSRFAFLSASESLFQLMLRRNRPVAVLYFDLDDFKQINDTRGHAGGDAVLRHFGSVLSRETRKSDLSGRLGGEEFAVLLPETERKGAAHIAEKIRRAVETSEVNFSNNIISYSVSIGISILSEENKVSLEDLIAQADMALYSAKNTGKNRAVLFSEL
jgi:diguanylate cyclase (GGDEF)-like protein